MNTTNIDFLETESVVSLNETGTDLAKAGEMQEAEKKFLKAIEFDPYYPKSYHNLGILQAAQHKTKEAIKNIEKLIELEPESPEHYDNLGIVYFLEESFHDSESCFKKALEIDKNHPGALFNLGKLLFNMERTDEALSLIEQFHNIENLNTEAMDVLGMCFLKKNDKAKAKLIWEKALDIDPDLYQVKNRLQELNISAI